LGEQNGDPDGGPGGGIGPGGTEWGLAGRGYLSLPKPPAAENEEGNIKIRISVDRNGNVVKAEYEPSGSTITNPTLISQAIAAAKKAKFTAKADAEPTQIGFITYKYRY
jgi:TonB family protein